MAESIPSLRVKHPSQDGAQFLERHAARVASTGIQVPTANQRPIGSRVRLILELKSGEFVVGDAVVEAHVRIRDTPGILLRYVRLHEGGIVFPLPSGPSPAPRPASAARPTPPAQPAMRAAPTPVARTVPPRAAIPTPVIPTPAIPAPVEPAATLRDLLDDPDPFPGLDAAHVPPTEVPIEVPDAPPAEPAALEPPPARARLTLDDLQLEAGPATARPTSSAPYAEEDEGLWREPAGEPALAALAPPEFSAPEPAAEAPRDAVAGPHEAPRRGSRRKALALGAALLAVLVASGAGYLLLHRRGSPTPAAAPATATCERASGTVEVQRRFDGTWRPLAAGGGLGNGDVVRTGPASSARVAFAAGGALELEADATVEIGVSAPATKDGAAAPPASTVAVQAGVVRGVLPSASDSQPLGLVIRAEDGSTTRLATAKGSPPAEVRLTRAPAGTEVAVTEGEVEVGSGKGGRKVGAGRAIDLPPAAGKPVVTLLDFPASVAPGVDARFKWRKGLKVRLSWKAVASAAGYRVQVSRALSFETVSGTFETSGTEISFAPEAEGLYAWRVASRDDAGRYGEYGFARRLYCDRSRSRDLLVGPADREALTYTGPAAAVTFTWQSAADARSYRLVVATSSRLRRRPVVSRVTKEQRLEVKGLAPGTYYWGVFVGDGPSASPIFQSPRSLVITRPARAASRTRR
jgi:hypothetical protein